MAATEVDSQEGNGSRRSSWRNSIFAAGGGLADAGLGVAMRVPGLFIIDHWWRYERAKITPIENMDIMQTLLSNVVLLHGFLLLLLPIQHLKTLYSHVLSGLLLFASHFISERYVSLEMAGIQPNRHVISDSSRWTYADVYGPREAALFNLPLGPFSRHLFALFCHLTISMAVYLFLERPSKSLNVLLCVHSLPVFARLARFPLATLPVLQTFGDTLVCLSVLYYMCYRLPSILDRIKETYSDAMAIGHRGIDTMQLLSLLWSRLFVPTHFVVFWTLSLCGRAAEALGSDSGHSPRPLMFLLQCASALCCSPITLLATAVVVSYLSNLVICGARRFLGAANEDNPMHSGWTQGVTMLLLGLQTGLMQVELPGRSLALLVILFIVVSSLLQSILEITEPVILRLSASRSLSKWRHFKVLLVCVALFVLPLLLTFKLANILPIDAWIVMVLSTCVLTSVQVLGMLTVHGLFVYDGMHEQGADLDDVLYIARASTKALELVVSLFVVAASVYESSTGKWNLANSTILFVHSYCNVYRRIRSGWRSFLLRREASMKTEKLASPTAAQLLEHSDVCPICYLWLASPDGKEGSAGGEPSAAAVAACCITPCRHHFHRNCLKKWLYSQDACPMCHQKIIVHLAEAPGEDDFAEEDPLFE